jgi:hypothetical protein
MIPIDSDENKYLTNMIYGKTARIIAGSRGLRMEVFEEFLVENKINAYEFVTLIIHEVMHFALGHMNLLNKRKQTMQEQQIDNIVYDAVVNSVICKRYNLEPEFQTLFTKLYKGDELPYAFLRPNSNMDDPYLKQVYDDLYSVNSVSMYELKQAITDSMPEGGECIKILLLGGHSKVEIGEDGKVKASVGEDEGEDNSEQDEDAESSEDSEDGDQQPCDGDSEQDKDGNGGEGEGDKPIIDPEILSAIADALKELSDSGVEPGKRKAKKGSKGCDPTASTLYQETADDFVTEYRHDVEQDIPIIAVPVNFVKVIEKDFLKIRGSRSTRSVMPQHKDRKFALYKAMNVRQIFYRMPLPDVNLYVTAYLDVSGSTDSYHKIFFDTIKYNKEHFDEVYAFSTFVYQCTEADIENKHFQTSGGTNDCWMEHLCGQNNYNESYGRIAFVFTDGCFNGTFWKQMDVKNTKIIVIYMKDWKDTSYFDNFPEAIFRSYQIDPSGKWDQV